MFFSFIEDEIDPWNQSRDRERDKCDWFGVWEIWVDGCRPTRIYRAYAKIRKADRIGWRSLFNEYFIIQLYWKQVGFTKALQL